MRSLLPRVARAPLATALLALATVAACGDDDAVTAPTPAPARLKVVHAVGDAPPVDVRVDDGAAAVTGLAFRQSTPAYLVVPSGERRLRVLPTGTQTAVIDARATIAPEADVTVIATGRVSGGNVAPLVLVDSNTTPAAGQVRVRVVHAAATVGSVDVYVSAPGAALPASPTLAGVPFRAASGYLAVPAGSYQVRVTPAGQRGTVAIDVTTPALPAGLVAKAIAVDPLTAGQAPTVIFTLDRVP